MQKPPEKKSGRVVLATSREIASHTTARERWEYEAGGGASVCHVDLVVQRTCTVPKRILCVLGIKPSVKEAVSVVV